MHHPALRSRYSGLSISLHWLMVMLIAGVYACIELKGNFPKGSDTRELLKQWHFILGLSVFALVWLRILARTLSAVPAITPPLPGKVFQPNWCTWRYTA